MNNKKAWLIGCGSALALLLVAVIAVIIFAVNGWNSFMGTSDKTAKAVFGDKLPEGYWSIGIPMESKSAKTTRMVMMVNSKTGLILIAVESPNKDKKAATFIHNPKKAEKMVESYIAKSGNSNQRREVHQFAFSKLTLEKGRTYPSFHLVMEDKATGEYSPMVGTFLLYPNNRMVTLISVNPKANSEDAEEDYSETFPKMEKEIARIIKTTQLKNNLETETSQESAPN